MTKYTLDQVNCRIMQPEPTPEVLEIAPVGSRAYHELFEVGVPETFIIDSIVTDRQAVVYRQPELRPVIRFATDVDDNIIGVEPLSGHVVAFLSGPRDEPEVYFVNSSLSAYRRTLKDLTEAFPYEYFDENGEDQRKDVRHLIELADPESLCPPPDGCRAYWAGFLGDVEINSYDLDAVLDPDNF